ASTRLWLGAISPSLYPRILPTPLSPSFPSTTLFRSALGIEADVARETDTARRAARAGEARRLLMPDEMGEIFKAIALTRDLDARSEEHTSELQSREKLVCRLLLEKKKK